MSTLVIDDEAFVRKLLAHMLGRLGLADVLACEGGQTCLDLLGSRSDIDLIFCDLQMPGMDGVEFIRHLVERDYAGALVLVSGEDERILHTAGRLARAHRLHVLGEVRKPVTPDQLHRVLERRGSATTRCIAVRNRQYSPDELRQALESRQLVNHYQPKVSLETATLAGVETLVRWNHPEDGLVSPDRFIPLAEEHGLIDALTHQVLETALRDMRKLLDGGNAIQVAVNVSMENLRALDFPEYVARTALEAGVPLAALVLEVTESRLMDDPLSALEILTRLRLKRIGLSIDDFGTGHSSLAQLRDIPFSELKLDRSFVHGAAQDPSQRAILDASLDLARQLGISTVAEGVEDRDDWELLRMRGCNLAQGWFISRPLEAGALPSWIAAWNARRGDILGYR
jgi:EAL domain-containing protein (putative c-di-GMP-specific phosphodiesterase class I)/ActR/RegA family two-component response regulator